MAHPVDFDAIDERPVDIVFLLLAPEGAGADHLKALARVSRLLRDRSLVEKLRATESADALYALLVESVPARAPQLARATCARCLSVCGRALEMRLGVLVDQRRLEIVLADQRLRDLDRGRGGHRLAVGGEDADRMRAVGQVDRLDVGDLLRAEAQEGLVGEGREQWSSRFPWLPPWQRQREPEYGAR